MTRKHSMPFLTKEEVYDLFRRVVSGENVYDEEIDDALDDLIAFEYEGDDMQEVIDLFTSIQNERAADDKNEYTNDSDQNIENSIHDIKHKKSDYEHIVKYYGMDEKPGKSHRFGGIVFVVLCLVLLGIIAMVSFDPKEEARREAESIKYLFPICMNECIENWYPPGTPLREIKMRCTLFCRQ